LQGAEEGTFVIRNSSKPDCYALSYVNSKKLISHSLIEKTVQYLF
jgi:hypothetical protein